MHVSEWLQRDRNNIDAVTTTCYGCFYRSGTSIQVMTLSKLNLPFRLQGDGDGMECVCVREREDCCCTQEMLGSKEEQSVLRRFLFCCFMKWKACFNPLTHTHSHYRPHTYTRTYIYMCGYIYILTHTHTQSHPVRASRPSCGCCSPLDHRIHNNLPE